MGFTATLPSPPLRPFVERLWDCRMTAFGHVRERVLPTGAAGLIVNLAEDQTRSYDEDARCILMPGAVFQGPRSRSIVIDTMEQQAVMGVEFRHGGALAFAREPLDRMGDLEFGLEDLSGSRARRLRERLLDAATPVRRLALLDAWLRQRLRDAEAPDRRIVAAGGRLADSPVHDRVEGLARGLGMSVRSFTQHFREHVGLGPKRYARLQRFRAVVSAVHGRRGVDWAGVAADCGFTDQPHLVREFQAFSGLTPGAYLARSPQYANHVAIA